MPFHYHVPVSGVAQRLGEGGPCTCPNERKEPLVEPRLVRGDEGIRKPRAHDGKAVALRFQRVGCASGPLVRELHFAATTPQGALAMARPLLERRG